MQIDQLVIEVTRRCNFECEHCLRGEKQNKNIKIDLINKFIELNDIESVNSLTFTGGEPLLNIKAINYILKSILEKQIGVSSFYLVTNGTIDPTPILYNLGQLYNIIDDTDISGIYISSGEYHDNNINNTMHPVWNLINYSHRINPEWQYIIAEGRGKNVNPRGRKVDANNIWEWDEENIYEGMIYINALGQICTDCDMSYETQKKYNLGHCLDKKLIEFKS